MFSEIINPFLNVRNKIKDTSGNWIDEVKPRETQYIVQETRQPVDGSTEEVLFDVWDKRIIIDSLALGSDTTAYPVLWTIEGETSVAQNNLFRNLTRTGGSSGAWATVIEAQGHHLLEIGSSDESGATLFLKRPIILPNGGKLMFTGSSGSSGEMSYQVYWREIKEGE